MPKSTPADYLSFNEYSEALGVFQAVVGLLLYEFARYGAGYRDTIIRNTLARTHVMAGAVFTLWKADNYQDCWILYRSLMDRLFHLCDLNKRDEFELFEAWSLLQQYHAVNRIKSDPEFRFAAEASPVSPTQKDRVELLLESPPRWRRPKAQEVAKDLGMGFLYRFGYDYASTHVHPMANDGEQDFYRITKLEPVPPYPDQRVVLSDTILIATTIVQEGLSASTLYWRRVVYDFIDGLRHFLGDGNPVYRQSFVGLGRMVEQKIPLCERKPADQSTERTSG